MKNEREAQTVSTPMGSWDEGGKVESVSYCSFISITLSSKGGV